MREQKKKSKVRKEGDAVGLTPMRDPYKGRAQNGYIQITGNHGFWSMIKVHSVT